MASIRSSEHRGIAQTHNWGTMTVNIAFKTPDALVFATDGLATLMDVDGAGSETFLSSMENVEKLVLLSNDGPERDDTWAPLLAMFNGVGSIGNGSVATDLRTIDRQQPRLQAETVADYTKRIALALEERALSSLQTLPRPFHLILAGFDTISGTIRPSIYAVQWRIDGGDPMIYGVLETPGVGGAVSHQYGAHYAGVTEAVARFVEGYDPALPEQLGVMLAGMGNDAPPGLLEQLAQDARRIGGGAPLSNVDAAALAQRYAYLIVRGLFDRPQTAELSQHFSLQSAIDYCVFLAQCAYARETLSPTRKGPPRVGSTLQVAYVAAGERPIKLAGIRLGLRVHGYLPGATGT